MTMKIFQHPAFLQAALLAFVVCFHQARLEETEELPSTAVPELIGTSHKLEVDEGGTFRLICQYNDLGSKATVMWRKNQSYITLGSILWPGDPISNRSKVLPDQSLQVANASREDAGVYTCELGIKTAQKLAQHHTLHVKYPAKIIKVEPRNGVVSTHAGTDVTLRCESEGYPEPTTTWTLKDQEISHAEVQDNGRTLYIPKILPHHAGVYKCISSDGVNKPDEKSINVSVLSPPEVSTDPADNNVSVLMHKSVSLRCRVVQANPPPTIKWFYNGTLMPRSTTEELTIEETKLKDQGTYKCQVANQLGEPFENSFTLSVIYPPQIEVKDSWIHMGLGKTTVLSCTVHAEPPAIVTWLHNSSQIHPGNKKIMVKQSEHILTIRDFTHNDFGIYTCKAENDLSSTYEIITLSGMATPVELRIQESAPSEVTLWFKTRSYSPVTEFSLQYHQVSPMSDSQELLEYAVTNWTTITIPAQHFDHIYEQIYILQDLELGSTYEVVMRAFNDYGWNEPSNIFRFSVTEDNEHQNVAEEEEEENAPSKGTRNSQLQIVSLLTIIITFSRVFW